MPRRSVRLVHVEQYFVRIRGFDIWRRVQLARCPDERLIETLLNAFGWFGRVGSPGESVASTQSVIAIQRTEHTGRGGWISVTIPSANPQVRLQPVEGDDEPWFFDAMLEGRLRPADGRAYPRCLDGDWACPPLGLITPRDFHLFLDVIGNVLHPLNDEWLRWCPFDPHAFCPRAVSDAMRLHRTGGRSAFVGIQRSMSARILMDALPDPPWVVARESRDSDTWADDKPAAPLSGDDRAESTERPRPFEDDIRNGAGSHIEGHDPSDVGPDEGGNVSPSTETHATYLP